jgi:hypothetical protein
MQLRELLTILWKIGICLVQLIPIPFSLIRYHYKRSRKNFQRRLYIRRMGWDDNNAYLTKLAKAQKEAYGFVIGLLSLRY